MLAASSWRHRASATPFFDGPSISVLNWSGEQAREAPLPTGARRREISAQFLEQAQAEFRRGDLLQASEKAWGAVSHYVAAISEERGWPTRTHRETVNNARRILEEHPEPGPYLNLFKSMQTLHANFYQEILDARGVREGIGDALRLVDVLKNIDDVRAGRASFPVRTNGGPR